MRHLFLLFSILSFLTTNSEAATYYVKKTGNNSNTCPQAQNEATPKLTIASAFACIGTAVGAGAGHTVIVYAGTYVESLTNNMPGGSSESARFTFKSNSGDTVIIKPAGGFGVIVLNSTLGTHKYITIDGFILDGADQTEGGGEAIASNTNIVTTGIHVKNSTMRFTREQGILMGGSFHVFSNLTVHGNGRICVSGPGLCHGIYFYGHDSIIEKSVFYDHVNGYGTHVMKVLAVLLETFKDIT